MITKTDIQKLKVAVKSKPNDVLNEIKNAKLSKVFDLLNNLLKSKQMDMNPVFRSRLNMICSREDSTHTRVDLFTNIAIMFIEENETELAKASTKILLSFYEERDQIKDHFYAANLGVMMIYFLRGSSGEAVKYLHKAKDHAREIVPPHETLPYESALYDCASAFINIAKIAVHSYLNFVVTENKIDFISPIERISDKTERAQLYAHAYTAIGNAFRSVGDLHLKHHCYTEALRRAEWIDDEFLQLELNFKFARGIARHGVKEEAQDYYSTGARFAEKHGYLSHQLEACVFIGDCLFISNPLRAKIQYKEALKIAEKIGQVPSTLFKILAKLAYFYADSDPNDALKYLKRAQVLESEVNARETMHIESMALDAAQIKIAGETEKQARKHSQLAMKCATSGKREEAFKHNLIAAKIYWTAKEYNAMAKAISFADRYHAMKPEHRKMIYSVLMYLLQDKGVKYDLRKTLEVNQFCEQREISRADPEKTADILQNIIDELGKESKVDEPKERESPKVKAIRQMITINESRGSRWKDQIEELLYQLFPLKHLTYKGKPSDRANLILTNVTSGPFKEKEAFANYLANLLKKTQDKESS